MHRRPDGSLEHLTSDEYLRQRQAAGDPEEAASDFIMEHFR
jgi:hypothetical protein